MKYEVEIPDGKYCDELEPCPFLVNAEYDYCQLTGEGVEMDLSEDEDIGHYVKAAKCPAKVAE